MDTSENPLRNFVIDGSDKSVQDIVSKLCFISKIQEGEKVDVSQLQLQPDTWTTMINRTLSREQSRDKTLEFIRQITDDALDMAGKCLHSKHQFHNKMGHVIVHKLDESKAGMLNLLKTYESDRMYVSRLETLLVILNTKIEDLKNKINT